MLERDALDADLGEAAETLGQLVRRAGQPAPAEALDGRGGIGVEPQRASVARAWLSSCSFEPSRKRT